MRTLNLMAGAAMAALAAETGAGSGSSTTPAAAPPTADPKFYEAEAVERNPEPGVQPTKVMITIQAPDYKEAWENARMLTRVGSAEFAQDGGKAWSDPARTKAVIMRPGRYTIKAVASLQPRTTKTQAITVDQLEKVLADAGVKPSKEVQAVIDNLKKEGPGALINPTAASAAENKEPEKQAARG